MNRRLKSAIPILLAGALRCACPADAAETDLEAVRKAMGEFGVSIRHETRTTPGPSAKVPPLRRDKWEFVAGQLNPTIRYARYLNQPPDFQGAHRSLKNSDMGVGFDGPSFGNWYRGNAIRVLINGRDVFAERAASRIETDEGENGRLRLFWDLDQDRVVALNFVVTEEGNAIYARVDLPGTGGAVDALAVKLNCYPGGYGPAYKLPSHRWVATARNGAEVPKAAIGKVSPTVPFTNGEEWIFYADKLVDKGSLGLLALAEEQPAGEVQVSSYGQHTTLNYPAGTTSIHLAFYAYGVTNSAAKRLFLDSLPAEKQKLRELRFRTDE